MIDPHIARLDWPHHPIKMRVTTHTEESFRVHAVQKEGWTSEWLAAMPKGSILYDLGSNVGSYTLLAISLGHMVVAFEPGYANYARLCENLVLNNWLDKCIALPVAASHQTRMDWFQYSDLTPGAASHLIGQPPGQHPVFFHRQAVMCAKLDDLVPLFSLPQPTHIKLDVDGQESHALVGAEKTLAGVQGLMVELKPDGEKNVLAWLGKRGFQVTGRWDQRNGKLMGIAYCSLVRVA